MNLLCPNCQKPLTVPEQYAGQLMKCPLCDGTFTVPNLPSSPFEFGGAAGASEPLPVPPVPPSSSPNPYSSTSPTSPETYGFAPAPGSDPLRTQSQPRISEPSTTQPTGFTSAPGTTRSTAPSTPRLSLTFHPQWLQWVAPVTTLLTFILLFFTWTGVYEGDVRRVSQTAFGAAFADFYEDPFLRPKDTDKVNEFVMWKDEELKKINDGQEKKLDSYRPGVSLLTLVYVLLYFPVLLVTVAIVILPMLPLTLPPAVQNLLPWRWGIVALAHLVLFLFLGLQLLVNFDLENRYKLWVSAQPELQKPAQSDVYADARWRARRTEVENRLQRTTSLYFVVTLQVITILSASLVYSLGKNPSQPLPRIEVSW